MKSLDKFLEKTGFGRECNFPTKRQLDKAIAKYTMNVELQADILGYFGYENENEY